MQVACQPARSGRLLLAPPWHTRALVGLLLVVPLVGMVATPGGAPSSRAVSSYLPGLLVSAALAGYVCRFGLGGSIFSALLGRRWDSARRALQDVALAAALAASVLALDPILARVSAAPESVLAHALLPLTPAERAAWVSFALAAGVGEELVYRGYLQRQLATLGGSASFGLALQALLFGIAHGEHGGAVVARYALYGLLFGCLALLRKSLLPGILAHAAIDLSAGLG